LVAGRPNIQPIGSSSATAMGDGRLSPNQSSSPRRPPVVVVNLPFEQHSKVCGFFCKKFSMSTKLGILLDDVF